MTRRRPLPIDPDVEADDRPPTPIRVRLALASARHVLQQHRGVLVAIAAGGALGSLVRWWIAWAMPPVPAEFPWATFTVNLTGTFALGTLMVLVTEVFGPSRYVRPFLGVGVLGGFTTFSTYMLDTRDLLVAGRAGLAALYLFGTLALGLVAVWAAISLTRGLLAFAHSRAGRGETR